MLIESYGHSNNREDRGQRCGSDCLGKRGIFPWSNILFFFFLAPKLRVVHAVCRLSTGMVPWNQEESMHDSEIC